MIKFGKNIIHVHLSETQLVLWLPVTLQLILIVTLTTTAHPSQPSIACKSFLSQPPFLFISPQDRHHHHHNHHKEEYISKNRTSESPTAENLDYFIGVSLAIGAALTGAASNIVVAKIERISSSSLVTFR